MVMHSAVKSGGRVGLAATAAALAAAALLALAVLELVLAVIAPLDAPVAVERGRPKPAQLEAPMGVLKTADLFRGESVAEAETIEEELPETTLRLVLKGVTPTRGGFSGATIQTPDGKQAFFREGDEIVRGVTLSRVETFRAVITRNGRREALTLKNRPDEEASETAPPRATDAGASGGSEASRTPASSVELPDDIDERGARATVGNLAGDFMPVLQGYGFEADDILYAVDGKLFSPGEDGFEEILAKLRAGQPVTVTVARNGEPRDIRFTVPQLPGR